jgi:CubicO group peptidase (beta-lactamase class C family)
MATGGPQVCEGHVSPGFEAVRDAFVQNFVRRRELGGACCVYHLGEKVVDLWGGIRNKQTDEPWERDTMVVYIGLPDEVANARLATLSPPGMLRMLIGFRPARLLVEGLNPRSNISRALSANPGTAVYLDASRVYARNLEVPAGGRVGTARAMAHAYSVFATGGRELGIRNDTLEMLAAPAIPPVHGFYDECLKGEVQFSLGFMKPSATWRFGGPRSFGSPGTGGALGFADPDAGIGYGYITSRMGTVFTGDPRDVALREALYTALGSGPHHQATLSQIVS